MNIRLLFCLSCICLSLHGMDEGEWIGIEQYWDKGNRRDREFIYQYCKDNKIKNDQNCAVINAYLLLLGRDKQSHEGSVKFYESQIDEIEQKMRDNDDDFIEKRLLQKELSFKNARKKEADDRLQETIKQIEMGDVSENLGAPRTQKKLENAFDAISSLDPYAKKNSIYALKKATSNAEVQRRNKSKCSNFVEY